MECPNCKMNISNTATFCLHCGAQFNNPNMSEVQQTNSTSQPVNGAEQPMTNNGVANQNSNPTNCPSCNSPLEPGASFCANCGTKINGQVSFTLPVQSNDKELIKYYNAYFHGKYDKVVASGFSIGTFLFGPFWLIAYGLYGQALGYYILIVGIVFVGKVLSFILPPFSLIISVLEFIAAVAVAIHYAQEFTSYRLTKADYKINDILKSTEDENERILRCKRAGIPKLTIAIIVFIILSAIFVGVISITKVEKNRKLSFVSTAKEGSNRLNAYYALNGLECGGKTSSKLPSGIYYYSFTTARGFSAGELYDSKPSSPWNNNDVAGQIYIILKKDTKGYVADYAGVMVDSEGHGFGEFDSNGKVIKAYNINDLKYTDISKTNKANKVNFYNSLSNDDYEPSLDIEVNGTKLRDSIPGVKVTKAIKCFVEP